MTRTKLRQLIMQRQHLALAAAILRQYEHIDTAMGVERLIDILSVQIEAGQKEENTS